MVCVLGKSFGRSGSIVVVLTIALLAARVVAEQPARTPVKSSSGEAQFQRDENWIERQIRQFRTYPHLDRAYRLMESGRLGEARLELEKLLDIAPRDRQARTIYISVLYRLKSYQEVIRNANIILAELPQSVPTRLYRGLARQAVDHLDDAIADFQVVASALDVEKGDRIFALNMVTDLAIRRQNYVVALTALDSLVKIQQDFDTYFRLGLVLAALERFAEVDAAYRQALPLASDPAARARTLRALGDNAKKRQDLEGAREAFKAALKLDPRNPELMRALADIAYDKQDYAEAISWTRQGLAIKPNAADREFLATLLYAVEDYLSAIETLRQLLPEAGSPEQRHRTYMSLGYAYGATQQYAQAASAFREASKITSDAPTSIALAQALESAGQVDEAIKVLQAEVVARPTADTHAKLGLLYAKIGDNANAVRELQAATKGEIAGAAEDRHRVYMARGYAYTNLKQYAQAVEAFRGAAEIKKDLPTLMALSQALESVGRFRSATEALQEALRLHPSPEIHAKLGLLYARTGDEQKALSHLQDAIRASLPADLKLMAYKQLAYTYSQQGHYADARQAFEQAIALDPQDPALYAALGQTYIALGVFTDAIKALERGMALRETPPGLRTLGLAHMGAGNLEEAARINRRLLTLKGLSSTERGEVLENLGFIYSKLGRDQLAADTFREALATGRDEKSIRVSLGLTLAKAKRWQEALEQFRRALDIEKSATPLLYVARAYRELQNPKLASDYLTQALAHKDQLSPVEQRELYNELGYLYAEQHDYARAADFWKQSLAMEYDPSVALRLGQMQRLSGQNDEGRQTLEGITAFGLPPPLQAERFDELAQIYAKEQKLEQAIEAEKQAISLAPTAPRQYQLAEYHRDLGHVEDAIPHYEAAAALEPQKHLYAMALGYAYNQIGRYEAAAHSFETAAARDPDNVSLYKEAAYAQLRSNNTDQAAQWFKRAIDKQRLLPSASREDQKEREDDIYHMRQEVNRITNRFDLTAYQSFRSGTGRFSTTPSAVGGGVIPSQGGVELAYQPPVVGFRDERILQLFTRLLWTNQASSLELDEDSLQGGIGLRYKPLKTHNLYLSAEKLFKVGKNADDDWLLRALYGWDYGTDLKPRESLWNYTMVYGDLGYFVGSPSTWAYYGETRQGLTFHLADTLLISPHLVMDGRVQTPDPASVSYLEGGGGVSLRYLFNESSYESYRASAEVLIQYKGGAINAESGWVVTGVLRF